MFISPQYDHILQYVVYMHETILYTFIEETLPKPCKTQKDKLDAPEYIHNHVKLGEGYFLLDI